MRTLTCVLALAGSLALTGSGQITAAGEGARTIGFYNIHTKETLSVVYKRGGKHDAAALEKINHILRDHRRNETTQMDPGLIDLLWEIHSELGSKEPMHVISGYRSRATNEMLRKTVGGQASESRHILGKAVDVHFPDISIKQLRYSALIRERGGVGYYPTSAIPFVHVDTDRVRHWPRLPRYELALLFPNGSTRHLPADGGPITREDVRVAQAKHRDLAQQIAAFFEYRAGPKAADAAAVADARSKPGAGGVVADTAPVPRLVQAPQPVARPQPSQQVALAPAVAPGSRPAVAPQQPAQPVAAAEPRLLIGPTPARRPAVSVASLTGGAEGGLTLRGLIERELTKPLPKLAAADAGAGLPQPAKTDPSHWPTGWAAAPSYDEEHPDELSYRPFPVGPLLSEKVAFDNPALSQMVAPDVARTYDMVASQDREIAMTFRPGLQFAALMWSADKFAGAPPAEQAVGDGSGIRGRRVRTADK